MQEIVKYEKLPKRTISILQNISITVVVMVQGCNNALPLVDPWRIGMFFR